MKRLLLILLALLITAPAYATDVIDYPAETTPVSSDTLYLIKGSGGTGTDRKVLLGNLTKGLTLANFPASANVVSLLGADSYSTFRTLLGVQATLTNPVTGTGTHFYLPYWTAAGSIGALASLGTSGQVLTSNGSGYAPTWQTPGTGTITGTGNQYYLPIWTSSSAQGTLADLGTSGYVLTSNGVGAPPTWQATGAGSMVYPGSGVPVSTGGAWGTSLNITGISDSIAVSSSTIAASATAVKAAYDLLNAVKQDALTYPVTGVLTPSAGFLPKWGSSGNTLIDGLKMGTMTATKYCTYETATGLTCTSAGGAGDFKADGTVPMTGALVPSTAGGQIIGTNALPVGSVFIGTAATNNVQLTAGATAAAKIVTLPSQTGTITVAPTTTAAGQVFMGTTTAGLGTWSTNVFPSTGTAYYLPVFSATNTMTQLASSGTTGQVLTAVTGAIPAFTSGFNGTVGAITPAAGTFTTITVAAVTNDNYLKIINNSSRAPTGSVMELYPEANVWKLNNNGTEKTMAYLESPSFTTPEIGVATATSLMATGRVDGTVGVFKPAANAATTIVVATHGNAAYFFNSGDSDAHSIYTLPVPVGGEQYCITNQATITTKPCFTAPANVYITSAGVITGTAGTLTAGGALGDSACVVGVDSTHYMAYIQKGTWTPSAP